MNIRLLITILIFSVLIAACAPQPPAAINQAVNSDDQMVDNDQLDDDVMMEDDEMMEDDSMMKGESAAIEFSGTVLAGSQAPLLDFNQADYEKALASDKTILLYFYANWCPICRAEVPKMYSAFDKLQTDQVVGFRVNFNDNQTDDNEEALARAHGVAYQHTKVVIQNKKRILKSPESWDEQRYLDEINKLIQ